MSTTTKSAALASLLTELENHIFDLRPDRVRIAEILSLIASGRFEDVTGPNPHMRDWTNRLIASWAERAGAPKD